VSETTKAQAAAAERRFPASVFEHGVEPDARFSLANERTFLAWIRTGLALIAGGVALEALGLAIAPVFRIGASVLLILAGLLAPLQAWFGWTTTERALRQSRPLSSARLALPMAVIVMAVGVLVMIGVVVR
jgi:putative membrane protein